MRARVLRGRQLGFGSETRDEMTGARCSVLRLARHYFRPAQAVAFAIAWARATLLGT